MASFCLSAQAVAASQHASSLCHVSSAVLGLPKSYSSHVPKNHSMISQLHRPQQEFHLSVQHQRQRPSTSAARSRRHVLPRIVAAALEGGNLVFGCRIPQHYFVTKGSGDTDEGAGADAWETGSYDIALQNAGIADFNIQTYTSVMPPGAVLLSLEDAKPYFHHGAVLECIMASMNGTKGDRISAGVGRAKVRKIDDNTLIGGYAAEYKGNCSEAIVLEILKKDLEGIFNRRFDKTKFEMYEFEYVVEVAEVEKSYGTVLASICFVSFIEPIFQINVQK